MKPYLPLKPILPNRVEAVLLYQSYKKLSLEEIKQLLNAKTKRYGLLFKPFQMGKKKNEGFTLLRANNIFVLITQADKALPMAGFKRSLSSPYGQMFFKAGAQKVKSHKSHIFITVSKDVPMPFLDKLARESGIDPRPRFTQKEFEQALAVCADLSNIFMAKQKAEAIHWMQSNQLLAPHVFQSMLKDKLPLSLYIHPFLFSSGKNYSGKRAIGFHTLGADNFIGHEILFKEPQAPIPFLWQLNNVHEFIKLARMNKRLIPDNDTFGPTPYEKIQVDYKKPTGKDKAGLAIFTLKKSKTFNYEYKAQKEKK